MIKKGDYVTRNSYNHDIIFKVLNISDDIVYLKGIEVRLYADASINDVVKYNQDVIIDDDKIIKSINKNDDDRGNYFYLPGKILHIDGDNEYLQRCLDFYKEVGVKAIGRKVKESDMPFRINKLLLEYKPDVVIITGHDAYYKNKGNIDNINNYKNTLFFINTVREARKYERSHEKLVIIAGACQSNYEELIKAGANYASSPKRVNIHALDPAIIATTVALTERTKQIDLLKLLDKTKYGHDGMGGIIGNGLMYVGYPR